MEHLTNAEHDPLARAGDTRPGPGSPARTGQSRPFAILPTQLYAVRPYDGPSGNPAKSGQKRPRHRNAPAICSLYPDKSGHFRTWQANTGIRLSQSWGAGGGNQGRGQKRPKAATANQAPGLWTPA